jgi:hypothetical protein
MENYNFFQTQISKKVNCVSWLTVNFTNEFLEKNRGKVLNLISIENFINYQNA